MTATVGSMSMLSRAVPFPPPLEARQAPGDRLFRNRGDGSFEDVTGPSGLSSMARGYGQGVAVGDYDNDGHPDLFVSRWRSYALYRNRGDGTFEDVTAAAGLAGDRDWPTSAAFADLDNDGDLDLYVCHYLKWDADHPTLCRNAERSIPVSCDPRSFEALPDHFFRNDKGHFTDLTDQAGLVDRDGRGLGVVAVDVDDDNRVDLFVANDLSANYLLRNLGGFRFEEQGLTSGVACNAHGTYQAGMGVAAGDLDGDGRPELAVTNYFNESTTLFQNLGEGQFADHTSIVGLAVASRSKLGFGIAFLDVDNDGRLDLMTANGHLNDYRPDVPYAMQVQLLTGGRGGLLHDVTARSGPPLLVPHIGRGLAIGDLDNDGRVDAVMVAQNEPLVYLHNRTAGGHWLTITLEGTASNRDGVGARVVLDAGGLTSSRAPPWRRELPVGERPASPFRHRSGHADRPPRGPLAVGAGRSVQQPRRGQCLSRPGRESAAGLGSRHINSRATESMRRGEALLWERTMTRRTLVLPRRT